jgi:hypothetical protein
MAMELYVFINKSDMLSPELWQAKIRVVGFPLTLDTDFDPFHFIGFLPCLLRDKPTGFEYYFSENDGTGSLDSQEFDSVITIRWGGDLREMCAVMMAAGALANVVPALLHFIDDDVTLKGAAALVYVRQQIAEAENFLEQSD